MMEKERDSLARQEKGTLGLKAALGVLGVCILGLGIGLLIINLKESADNISHSEDTAIETQEMRNEAYTVYLKEGAVAAAGLYQPYIDNARTVDEKVGYLMRRIVDLNAFCGWGCSEQILEDVHSVADLDSGKSRELCFYEEAYLDQNIIEGCLRSNSSEGDSVDEE